MTSPLSQERRRWLGVVKSVAQSRRQSKGVGLGFDLKTVRAGTTFSLSAFLEASTTPDT